MKAIVTVGISCSGKTTFAKDVEENSDGDWVDINRDDVRFDTFCGGVRDWNRYKFKRNNEQRVTQICNDMIEDAAGEGLNIIISDTNLNKGRRESLVRDLERWGYEVEVKGFPVTLEEAWKRDAHRANGVGHSVIARQWQQWLEYSGRKRYVPDTSLPSCVIFDIDGTLADMHGEDGGRLRGPFEWDKVGGDRVRSHVAQAMHGVMSLSSPPDIILLSGRDSVCRNETDEWLDSNNLYFTSLYMRPEGSYEKDTKIKEEMFWEHIAPYYNVECVFDDRPVVCRMWTDIGLNVVNVGNPYIEF